MKAGLHDAKIMATSDLNEHRIAELVAAGAPIDSFGVGTELATSAMRLRCRPSTSWSR